MTKSNSKERRIDYFTESNSKERRIDYFTESNSKERRIDYFTESNSKERRIDYFTESNSREFNRGRTVEMDQRWSILIWNGDGCTFDVYPSPFLVRLAR